MAGLRPPASTHRGIYHGAKSAATAPASQARRLPLQLGPRGRPEITPEVRLQVFNPSKIRANPWQIRIQLVNPSIPSSLKTSPAHPTSICKKNLKSADIWCPKFYGSLPSCWAEAENETPRFFQPKHGRTKPKETLRFKFSDQNTGRPSQMKAAFEIRQMSVFPGPPEESQRNIADRKPEENQRHDQGK